MCFAGQSQATGTADTGKEVKGEDRGFQETSGQACFELGMVTVMDSHAWSWS